MTNLEQPPLREGMVDRYSQGAPFRRVQWVMWVSLIPILVLTQFFPHEPFLRNVWLVTLIVLMAIHGAANFLVSLVYWRKNFYLNLGGLIKGLLLVQGIMFVLLLLTGVVLRLIMYLAA